MKYCQTCILPDTRPGLIIAEDGVCNACRNALSKTTVIDWGKRENEFRRLVDHAQSQSKGYDCLIPVSGGKDSTWQVVTCLAYGLNPLTVTWKTPGRTTIGQHNLDNLIRLGVDHIDYTINPEVEKKFMVKTLETYGSPAIPMHLAIFNIPVKLAVMYDIPLIIWGENSAFEYGSDDESLTGFKMDRQWLRQHGVSQGTTAEDWISATLSRKELTPYFGPTDDDLERAGLRAIFLGYYFPWDPDQTAKVAAAHGFQTQKGKARTGYYDFADIDDDFISIHHYIKWYKFGITRTFDNLSLEIRNGRLSREEAITMIRSRGDETPHEDIKNFCSFVGITQERFYEMIEPFRNQDIWKKIDGKWVIEGFLIPDWSWDSPCAV